MARLPGIKAEDGQPGTYHIRTRVAGPADWYPLQKPATRRRFYRMLRLYTECYCCELLGWVLMGTHYHLLVRFEAYRQLSRQQLYRRAQLLYRDPAKVLKSEQQWQRFNRRLFDVSEFERNLNSHYARWYNRHYRRRGAFWGGRFKSSLCLDSEAVLEWLLYIELNPVRAGLVQRPEQWRYGSAFFRATAKDGWMMPLSEILSIPSQKVFAYYRSRLYARGAVAVKGNQGIIPAEIVARQSENRSISAGLYGQRLRFFTDGLLIGSATAVQDQIDYWRRKGRYQRRRRPIAQLDSRMFTLREQRGQLLSAQIP